MGETHLAITIEKLKRKFGVEVVTEEVPGPDLVTVTRPSKAEGKYKKQTGGRGQFGVAMLEVEPLPQLVPASSRRRQSRAAPSPASSSRRWRPGIEETTIRGGGINGFPVVDVRVRCVDGKYHSVDSSEMSFRMAGRDRIQVGNGRRRADHPRADLADLRSPCRPTTRAT